MASISNGLREFLAGCEDADLLALHSEARRLGDQDMVNAILEAMGRRRAFRPSFGWWCDECGESGEYSYAPETTLQEAVQRIRDDHCYQAPNCEAESLNVFLPTALARMGLEG